MENALDSRTLNPLAAAINMAHGEAIKHARSAVEAAVQAGVLLMRARLIFEGAHGASFQAWLADHCDFKMRTAYKYIALAERALPPETLQQALLVPFRSERPALPEVPAQLQAAGLTLTQLYRQLGIVSPTRAGGSRAGAGRPRGDAPQMDLSGLCRGALGALWAGIYDNDALSQRPAEDLFSLATRLRTMLADCDAELARRNMPLKEEL